MSHIWIEWYLLIGLLMAAKYGKSSVYKASTLEASITGLLWPIAMFVMWVTDNDH